MWGARDHDSYIGTACLHLGLGCSHFMRRDLHRNMRSDIAVDSNMWMLRRPEVQAGCAAHGPCQQSSRLDDIVSPTVVSSE